MCGLLLLLCLLMGLTYTDARINISPNQLPASTSTPSTFVVGFQVDNACSGSTKTNKLDIHFPQGFSDVIPVKHVGWTPSATVIAGNTTWTWEAMINIDAEIANNVMDTFEFRMTMPATPGSLPFSAIQYCMDGNSLSWTDIPFVVLSTANLAHVPSQENVFGELLSNIAIDSANAAVDAINALNDTVNAANDATNSANDATNAANDVTNAANDATNAAADSLNAANDAINAANDTKNAANDAVNAAADAKNTQDDATNAANDATNAAADAKNTQDDVANAAADAKNLQDDAANDANDATNAAQDTINSARDASVVTEVDQLRSSGLSGSSNWTRADTTAVIAIIIAGLSMLAMICMYSKLSILQQNDAYLRGHMTASRMKDIEMAPMLPHAKRSIITTVNSNDSEHEPAMMSSSASTYPRETRIHLPTSQQHQRSSSDGTYLTSTHASDVNFHD